MGGIICIWLVEDKISAETFVILNKLTGFVDKSSDHGTLYDSFYALTMKKYGMLLSSDLSRYRVILEQTIIEKQKEATKCLI